MTGRGRTSIATTAEVCARLVTGQTFARIQKEVGISKAAVQLARQVLERFGVHIERKAIAPIPNEVRQQALELLRSTDLSDRAIAAQLECSHGAVGRLRMAQLGPALLDGEEVPLCECGEYLHHPRLCWSRVAAIETKKGSPFAQLTVHQRREIYSRLMAGEITTSVAQAFGLKVTAIRNFVQRLPAENRAERSRNLKTPAARRKAVALSLQVAKPQAISPRADPLFAAVLSAMPRGLDRSLADDAAADAYLALVLGGRREPEDVKAAVKRAVSSNFKRFANPWGALSLDAQRSPDGDDTFVDTIEDPLALAAFDPF